MALRLKVNEELDGLSRAIPALIEGLATGGVLAIITFHSLEDRIVKHLFREHLHVGRLIKRKAIKPDDAEVARNPRSRSAKLRAFEKRLDTPKYGNKYREQQDNDDEGSDNED